MTESAAIKTLHAVNKLNNDCHKLRVYPPKGVVYLAEDCLKSVRYQGATEYLHAIDKLHLKIDECKKCGFDHVELNSFAYAVKALCKFM